MQPIEFKFLLNLFTDQGRNGTTIQFKQGHDSRLKYVSKIGNNWEW